MVIGKCWPYFIPLLTRQNFAGGSDITWRDSSLFSIVLPVTRFWAFGCCFGWGFGTGIIIVFAVDPFQLLLLPLFGLIIIPHLLTLLFLLDIVWTLVVNWLLPLHQADFGFLPRLLPLLLVPITPDPLLTPVVIDYLLLLLIDSGDYYRRTNPIVGPQSHPSIIIDH